MLHTDKKSKKGEELFWIIFNSLAMLSCLVALIICFVKNAPLEGTINFIFMLANLFCAVYHMKEYLRLKESK